MKPDNEVWYCWKEYARVEDCDDPPRLLTPCSDPHEYEFPFDWIFPTIEEAIAGKKSFVEDFMTDSDGSIPEEVDNWMLVKMTLEVV